MDSNFPPIRSGLFRTQRRSHAESPIANPTLYKSTLAGVHKHGHYFPVPKALAAAIGLDAASVLMLLVSLGGMRAGPDGFMQATPGWVAYSTGLSSEREALAVRLLVNEYELLEARDRGGQRHLRVDLRRLARVLEDRS